MVKLDKGKLYLSVDEKALSATSLNDWGGGNITSCVNLCIGGVLRDNWEIYL